MTENVATLQKLLQELQSGDRYERRVAAWALGQLKDPRATEPLLQALSHEKDDDVCAAIIWALGAPALRHIARCHEDTMLRESATRALALLADPESIEIFIEQGCRSYNPEVRLAVAHALGHLKVERAAFQLVSLLNDEDSRVREAAAEALRQIDKTVVVQGIRKRMEQESFLTSSISHVVDLLEHYNSKEAVELLSMLLQQPEPYFDFQNKEQNLRQRIARALGHLIGRTDQIDMLLQDKALSCAPVGIVQGILESLDRRAVSPRMQQFLLLMRNHPEMRKHPEVRQKIDEVLCCAPELER